MGRFQVVITDCDHPSIEEEKEEFGRIGAEARTQIQREKVRDPVMPGGGRAHHPYAVLNRRVLENLPKCRVVARYGVGVDSVDLKVATDLGIIVANVPDYCMDEVADQTVSMLSPALIRKQSSSTNQ